MSMGGELVEEWADKAKAKWVLKLRQAIELQDFKFVKDVTDEMDDHSF